MFKIANCTEFTPKRRTREEVNTYRIQVSGAKEDSITVVTDSEYGRRFKFKQPCRIYANNDSTIIDANEFWICNQDTPEEYIVLINSITEAIVAQCILANTYNKMIRISANEEGDINYYQIILAPMEPLADPNKPETMEYRNLYPKIKLDYDEISKSTKLKVLFGFRSADYVTVEEFSSNNNPFASINAALAYNDNKAFKALEALSYDSYIVQAVDGAVLKVKTLEDYYAKVIYADNADNLYNLPYSTLLKGISENAYYIISTNSDEFCFITDNYTIDPKEIIPAEECKSFASKINELIDEGLDEIITQTIEINLNNLDRELLESKIKLMEFASEKFKLILSEFEEWAKEYSNIFYIHRNDETDSTYIINVNDDSINDLLNLIETIRGYLK